ncbi:MAG: zinc-ribbon domain-containing protein [Nitrospirae bacterium]|nr:zinc-ribbon domain-containing protein [Nitrospirota bacterium]
MIANCPQCRVKLKVDDAKIPSQGGKIRCPRCQTVFRVERVTPTARGVSPSLQPAPMGIGVAPAPAAEKPAVLVAHDSEEIRAPVRRILERGGYRVIEAADGVEAIIRMEKERPFAALLDVGLPKIYGFEVCERMKSPPGMSGTFVILLASIFDKTRYKRAPESLYGADDYIEKHHLEDALLPKLANFRQKVPTVPQKEIVREMAEQPVAPPLTEQEMATLTEVLKRDEVPPPVEEVDREQVEKAKRFARIIISDIALYNQKLVEEGIRHETLLDLLRNELQEGRNLYETRVAPDIRRLGDFFQQAIGDFVEKKRRTLGLRRTPERPFSFCQAGRINPAGVLRAIGP